MLDALEFILKIAMILTSIFMIGLVLIQRGKGGGLAGAFGATGGSSAFGTKSGDVFTRITITTGGIWILMSIMLVIVSNSNRSTGGSAFGNAATSNPASSTESRSRSVVPRSGEATESGVSEPVSGSAATGITQPSVPAPIGGGQAPERPVDSSSPKN